MSTKTKQNMRLSDSAVAESAAVINAAMEGYCVPDDEVEEEEGAPRFIFLRFDLTDPVVITTEAKKSREVKR